MNLNLVLILVICLAICMKLNVSNKLTISGLSGGGYESVQFLFSHSSIVNGAAIIAGGPYYCSQEYYLTLALTACMKDPILIDVELLIGCAKTFESFGWIDSLEYLKSKKVYLYSGSEDTVVHPGVMKKLEEMLGRLGIKNVTKQYDVPSEHGMITDFHGNECGYLGSPYINNCGFDLAGDILKAIHFDGEFNPRVEEVVEDNFFKFPQSSLLVSMNDFGIAYIPRSCQNGEKCDLHMNFHGCYQYFNLIGMEYVKYSGFARWAESNNIILIFPQTDLNELLNPHGCFDWWGYSGVNYPISLGEQILFFRSVIHAFFENTIDLKKF